MSTPKYKFKIVCKTCGKTIDVECRQRKPNEEVTAFVQNRVARAADVAHQVASFLCDATHFDLLLPVYKDPAKPDDILPIGTVGDEPYHASP